MYHHSNLFKQNNLPEPMKNITRQIPTSYKVFLVIFIAAVLTITGFGFSNSHNSCNTKFFGLVSAGEDNCPDVYTNEAVCVGDVICHCWGSLTGKFVTRPDENGECPDFSGTVCVAKTVEGNEPYGEFPARCEIAQQLAEQSLPNCPLGCVEGETSDPVVVDSGTCCAVALYKSCSEE
jgi:hypothetical protein